VRKPFDQPQRPPYSRRVPEDTILYETVRAQVETVLARAQADGQRFSSIR
jgi:hypothetical protein